MEANNFDFFITSITRPADYYLGCCNGSVYLDFKDINDTVCLIRMSFDGFGCCSLGDIATPLNREDSTAFKKMFQKQTIDQHIMKCLVKKAIFLNKSLIWEEALERYKLNEDE